MIEAKLTRRRYKVQGTLFCKIKSSKYRGKTTSLDTELCIFYLLLGQGDALGGCVGYALLQKKHRRIPATVGDGNIWQIVNETPP